MRAVWLSYRLSKNKEVLLINKILDEESSALLEKIIDNYLSKLIADYLSDTTSDKVAILAECSEIYKLNFKLGLDLPGVLFL